MIDVNRETLITLNEVCKRIPSRTGGKLRYETVRQWATTGCRGVVLETIKIGGGRFTSREALQRFGERLSGRDQSNSKPRRRRPRKSRREELRERFGV